MARVSPILPSPELDRKVLDYVLAVTSRARGWWEQELEGTALSRRAEFAEYRLRMEGRRSVAQLYHDAKNEPFDGASNIGVGLESIFAEFLIPLLLANTHDLEPMLQVIGRGTKVVDEDRTSFHDHFHRYEVPGKRELLEHSLREVLTVGSAFHKWTYGSLWRQSEVDFPVWLHPLSGQPILSMDAGSGRPLPQPADPKTPREAWPVDPATGIPMKLGSLKAVKPLLLREGPELAVRPAEAIGFPDGETRADPDLWEWLSDDFEVSPYWFLGREGEPFHGKLRLEALWRWLTIDPNDLYRDPVKLAAQMKPIRLRAFFGQYPAAADGAPVQIMALVALDAKLLLGWRPSPFPRKPYTQRQVWHSGVCPLGRGIPETLFSLRGAMDALLNQQIDSGNLYNHPPLLLSDLAMLEDEDYETTGPGATWVLRDINGAKFLPTPIGERHPVELLNWLMSEAQRFWGVTDLTLNAPSESLSPSVKTATGTVAILNQGSIKFGHLTKRLSATDTVEYQLVHDLFRLMLANPLSVVQEGQPQLLEAAQREAYFSDTFRVASVGNGIATNPLLRQQSLTQFMGLMVQNPFVTGDLETYKQLTDQLIASFGLDLTTKEPEALQQSKLFLELMQTPEGQQAIPAVLQQVIQAVQARAATTKGNGNGRLALTAR